MPLDKDTRAVFANVLRIAREGSEAVTVTTRYHQYDTPSRREWNVTASATGHRSYAKATGLSVRTVARGVSA